MTVYSAIANSEIAVGAPLTNNLATKWRDNHLAQGEGDPTAPEINGGAITNGTILYASLNLSNSIVADDIAANAVGKPELASDVVGDSEFDFSFSSWTQVFSNGTTTFPAGMYIIGGFSGTSADIEVYNPASAAWAVLTTGSNQPTFVCSSAVANQVRVNNTSGSNRTLGGHKLD